METIREIVSFSHDGIGHMWYPFSAKLEPSNSVISAEYYFEIGELMSLLQSMFATNNHSPEIVKKGNIRQARRLLVGEKVRRNECSITFKTDKNEYQLRRCFFGQYSIEARLHKIGSSIVYHGHDVIQVLSKFHKPIIVDEGSLYNNNSIIFKPVDNFCRSSMVALANNWARMIGLHDSRIGLDFTGRWSSRGEFDSFNSRKHSHRSRVPSPLRILSHLAQAVMKKRTFGACVPILTPFNVESLNEFEAITMLDLIRNVCKEEGLQFIVGINTKSEINSMVNAIETPKLSIYEC